MVIGSFHHSYHSNKLIKVIDSMYIKLLSLYGFYWYHTCFEYLICFMGVLGCFVVVYTLDVKDRSWNNILYLTPHMLMHVCSGTGIYFLMIENVQSGSVEGAEG